ncbi:MAG: AraC family transcriptional regulator [bacterium]|nr:AraC family transcriptional regulator [bacterium]
MGPIIRLNSSVARAALEFVAAAGGPARSLRDEAGITAADLANPRRMLDLHRVVTLFNAAARELGDDALGLHVGASFGLATLGPFSYAVLNAPTVAVGLANLARYSAALGQGLGTPPLEVRGETATLEIPRIPAADRNALRHLAEAGLVMLVRMMRRLRGPDWQPHDVSFQHDAPSDPREHVAAICPRLRFGCTVASISFDARDLRAEVPGADRYLLPIAEHQLQDALEPTEGSDPWLRDVEMLVASRVCDGHPPIRSVAPQLGLSVRTLQRRLEERSILYRDLVARVRFQLARRYLEETVNDLEEIAFLLGYSELSAFDHAFRRWTGQTPQGFRRKARAPTTAAHRRSQKV